MANAAPEVPDYFHDLQVANADAFPVAWAIYLNNQEKDEAIGELDQKESTEKLEGSYVASIGKFIEPVMRPLGFDWKMSVSLVTALAAKEVMVSTLGTLYSIAADEDNEQPLQVYLRQDPSFTHSLQLV
ncbi:nucleoside recognition domain-containing protein [Veillonella sp. LMAG:2]|uniref:nucleoside recognition domain-containing protein n=1 Tax=Veillonella sp. LMAG:2 TaxID=1969164 RepID=UPI0025FED79D|nr:nucleoside recognition domain-containing protein [Veillonella sp. LMAG:2]